jgi:hypothetical protein
MPDDEPANAQRHDLPSIFFRFTSILAIAFAVYVLSIGPAAKICWMNNAAFDKITPIYAPLLSLAGHSPKFQAALERYLTFWGLPN